MVHYLIKLNILFLATVVVALLVFLYTRLGFGGPFPSQSQFTESPPLISESALEIVAELPIPAGNLAVHKNGRIFFNFHPEYGTTDIKIAELTSKREYVPFPSAKFQNEIVSCLSMRLDSDDNLWLLDFAHHGFGGQPRLYAVNINTRETVVNYTFPSEIAGKGSMLNDFQIDQYGEFVYIVDTSIVAKTPAIIVYSIHHKRCVRILSGHAALYGPSVHLQVKGDNSKPVKFGTFGMRIHADTFALDRSGSTLYFGAVTSDKLYSISTSHLLFYYNKYYESADTAEFMDASLANMVKEITAEKPATDGASSDACGNLWLTAIEHSALAVALPVTARADERGSALGEIPSNRRYEMVKAVQSTKLLNWPDGLSFGADGLYISNSALHLKFTGADMASHAPYYIIRVPTAAIEAVPALHTCKSILPRAGQ